METKTITPGKFGLSYGIILGLIAIVVNVIMYVTGMSLEGVQWPMNIFYLIFAVFIFYAVSQHKKQNGNLLSLGEALKVGTLIGLISGVVTTIYVLLFNYVIAPEFMSEMMEMQLDKLRENPDLTEEMIEQSRSVSEFFMNPFIFSAIVLASYTFFGFLYSLIAGLIMKKEAPQY